MESMFVHVKMREGRRFDGDGVPRLFEDDVPWNEAASWIGDKLASIGIDAVLDGIKIEIELSHVAPERANPSTRRHR
jgi:hypothetical protein